MGLLILIAGTAFTIFWRAADINITLEAKAEGIGKEETGVVASGGQLVAWKAYVVISVILTASWVAFFNIEPEYEFVPGIIAALGGVASMIAYYSNKKNIRNRRAKRKQNS